jgi:hypothetical protein
MESDNNVFIKAVELIKAGKNNEASEIVIKNIRNEIVNFLTYKYRWQKDEALSIFHDAWLLISDKIANNEINEFNKAYIYKTSTFIGANQYRRHINQKLKVENYLKEEHKKYNESMNDYCGVVVFDDEEEMTGSWEKAIRSFSILDKNCQNYINLKYVDDLSHQEIVRNLKNINTIRASITTLNRCIKKWRELMQKISQV